MNQTKTLQEALELVPEYIMVDRWQEGDECNMWDEEKFCYAWYPFPARDPDAARRRPVPQEVREAFALIALERNKEILTREYWDALETVGAWLLSQGGSK